MNGETINITKICATINGKLKERYEQQWLTAINKTSTNGTNGNKLRTYCKFKTAFSMENYLLINNNKSDRAALSKLRISAHKLMIEVGRHIRPKLKPNERFCKFCKDGSIEDEKHFIINCSIYEADRSKFFEALRNLLPGITNLASDPDAFLNVILSCYQGDAEVCSLVNKYVKQCMDIRENALITC